MSKIFKEYGGVVTVVVAIVALIGLVVFLMTDTGVMANAFGNITGQFVEKSEQLIEDVGSIDGNQAVQTFYKQEPETLSFRSEAPKSEFREVQVNGVTIDDDNYTVTEGSTIITLSVEYMGTLPEGTYTLTIVSESGSVTITFKVVDDVKPEDGNGGSGEPGGDSGNNGGTVVEPKAALSDYSWAEIQAIAQDDSIDLANYNIKIGDTITDENGIVYYLVSDERAEAYDGLVFMYRSDKHHRYNSESAKYTYGHNFGGYANSEMHSYLSDENGELYSALPSNIKNAIKDVTISCNDGLLEADGITQADNINQSVTTKLFLPSLSEVRPITSSTEENYQRRNALIAEGTIFDYFNTDVTTRYTNAKTISDAGWWLRSASGASEFYVHRITESGSNNIYSAKTGLIVTPAFVIG